MDSSIYSELKGGKIDPNSQTTSLDDVAFIPSTRNSDGIDGIIRKKPADVKPKPDPNLKPKLDTGKGFKQDLPKLKIRYAKPDDEDPGGSNFNSNNEDDIPDSGKAISDPEFWNDILEDKDKEEEETVSKDAPASAPTKDLTLKSLKDKKNKSVTKTFHPREYTDWDGKELTIKSKELRRATFSHRFEAGVTTKDDLVECPIQEDYLNKHQRENCSRITDVNLEAFSDKIVDLTSAKSGKIGKIKFKRMMPYYDTEMSIGHMDLLTGDCFFFNENGKFLGYKKYTPEETSKLMVEVQSSLKWAADSSKGWGSDSSSPRSDL